MTAAPVYQLQLLAEIDSRVDVILDRLFKRLGELGIAAETIRVIKECDASVRDTALPATALFLGYAGADDAGHPSLQALLDDSIVIITCVSDLDRVWDEIPPKLRHVNALEVQAPNQNIDRVVSLILENFRLLRQERRLFISYRRIDSKAVADQLYDAFDARGFDVFIDTRTVPPAIDFQAELWHRLSDSDVVVLIDTEHFRNSRWTVDEMARANLTNIQILHVLWPGQAEDPTSAFSYFHSLDDVDFAAPPPFDTAALLGDAALAAICDKAETLRARAMAARHNYLIDSFCDNARDRGFTPVLQPERWIEIELAANKTLAVVPMVGVPGAPGINKIFHAISLVGSGTGGIWVLYDSRGLLASWLTHLGWLGDYLPARTVQLASIDAELRILSR